MNMNAKSIYLSAIVISVAALTACSGPQVRYGDAKAVETVNADYGSTDLQMIAESMTRSLLQSKAISGSKDAPIVTLADVKNKTSEYIDTRVITDKIRTQLMKSGQVRFAVSISEMQNQTDELKRQNQSGLYKNSTIAKTGNMQGAQYRIEGSIASIVKNTKDVKDVYYVFNLNLINNESGLLEWADEKEIRKTATR
ncbi:penicillin-binding protein activator LpoB [Polynucleobacter sp. MWH-Braz-FAM2G]|uniref:penicillin-binding protein activator LpoB n=1 Tax=Polynucleobacter sp. MWH-Braz-FAM2G TaxID=1855883 RepID=UPI001BFE5FF6|nr:penicillin-binding protein activator LpoB [Polynucleobacter sp. MWH-Braz-FAM2G]